MVRIAHFSDAAADGVNGIATSIRLLTGQLSELGHESLVVSTGRGGIKVPSLPTGMGDFRFALVPLLPMRKRVLAWRPDVAHVHTPGPLGAAGMTVARELGIPAVYTYHTDMHGYSAFYHFPTPVIRAGTALYARRLRRGARVDGWGKYAAVEAANARIFEAARVIILPTATALRHCRTADSYAHKTRVIATPPGHRSERARSGTSSTVLFVGRVSEEKGIPLLLDAFALLRRDRPEARLVLAGPVSRRLGLRRRLDRAGLTSSTLVTGVLHDEEVLAAYRGAGVFAFPSTTDTQGLVLHEAALAGLPIVMVDRELAAGHPLGGAVRLADPEPASLASALRASLTEDRDAQVQKAFQIAYALTPALFAERTLDAYRAALTGDRE
ncbi:glycosyltransferase [Paractinoplanes globisporus]|uniref:Glycosyltransferase n=1 Tax=Paractinoplanes globisporus TaxID=113565 RepID=A0ABW6W5P0_9ACTN|nr:glycosyltransferase [Actinoplanes globisporus]